MDPLAALVKMITDTGYVAVNCNNGLSPREVDIELPAGIGIHLDYATYQQIRQAAGLPDDVCQEDGQ